MLTSLARPNWTTDANWLKAASRGDRLSTAQRAAALAHVADIDTVDGQAITAMDHQAVWRQVTFPATPP